MEYDILVLVVTTSRGSGSWGRCQSLLSKMDSLGLVTSLERDDSVSSSPSTKGRIISSKPTSSTLIRFTSGRFLTLFKTWKRGQSLVHADQSKNLLTEIASSSSSSYSCSISAIRPKPRSRRMFLNVAASSVICYRHTVSDPPSRKPLSAVPRYDLGVSPALVE